MAAGGELMIIEGVACRLFAAEQPEQAPLAVSIGAAASCAWLCEHSGCRILTADAGGVVSGVEGAVRLLLSAGAQAVIGVKEGGNLAALAARDAAGALMCQLLVFAALDATAAEARDWAGAPPTLIITSERDPWREQSERFARRLEAFGTPVELAIVEEVSVAAESEALWLCAERLRDVFGLPAPVPIGDVLDLHTVHPKDVRAVVEEYLREARGRGFRQVRLIHGRGIGVQREIVRSILARTPFVHSFGDAPPEAGGWGATLARFR